MSGWSPRHVLFLSVISLLVLLVAVSVLALNVTRDVDRSLQAALDEQELKRGLIATMFRMNRDWARLVNQLFAEENSATWSHAAERYRVLREEFSSAQAELATLHLAPAEREALAALASAAGRERQARDEVVALVSRGDLSAARKVLGSSAVATQEAFQEALYRMVDATRLATTDVVREARHSTRAMLMTLAILACLVLLGAAVAAVFAIRQIRRAEYELQLKKELAQVTLHSIGDGVITADAEGRVEYLNPVAEQYTGWATEDARGRPITEIYRVIDERTGRAFDALGVQSAPTPGEEAEAVSVRLVDRSGRECPIRYSHAPIRSNDGRSLGMIVVFHDISQIRAMAQQLLWQASHDALTGLVNRREFERRLTDLIDTARTQGREHALMFMDLDNFKAVNDTCGHTAGDELLRQLTSVMLSRMRGSDTLARLGGDEFAALLETCPFDQALRIANAMRETVREFRFVWEGKTFSIGVSIGLIPINSQSGNLNRVLRLADACCYEAKNKGRDRVQVCRPEGDVSEGELHVVSQINQAFELGRFRLYRQRIVPVRQGSPEEEHYEVLVRMVDRAGNLVPPTGFMPAAERYNLLTSIERWVVESLIEYLHNQLSSGVIPREAPERGWYSVNLSGTSINDRSLPEFLRNLLTRYQLPAGLLCIEITETTAISNLTAAAELMTELKGMGCRFALDDFGTGMSSFAYLKHLPVDVLKIAGTFITDIATDPMDCAIVDAINRISHMLGMKTVAESVENAATLAKIRELEIDYAQGYYIAEPEALVHAPTGEPVEFASA